MATTAAQASPRLIAFVLPGIPASVPAARRRVRATLGSRGLGEYADDAEIIISELVANAVQHACDNDATTIGVTLTHAARMAVLTVAVSDSSPDGPIRRGTPPGSEHGRGLQIVAALSARWGWRREGGGKAVFAVLAREAWPVMADISDLSRLHDIDADYSPQYVKLARVLRDKIQSGQYRRGDILPAAELASQYKVSVRVTCNALAMLAANRYVSRPGSFRSYRVIWQAGAWCSADEIPQGQAAAVGANIRVLRQQHGWNQAKVGELMGWPSNSTVCAAEGRRNGRQRGFTADEVERLAAIFGISPTLLTTLCANCGGYPPTGFACLTCGARLQAWSLNPPPRFR